MISDMVKYDKLDKATDLLRQADVALGAFSRELGDVAMTGVSGVQIEGMTKTFDVFFDNIFSDLADRPRIQDAVGRVGQALRAVSSALGSL